MRQLGGTEQPAAMRADARRNRSRILLVAEEAFAKEGIGVPVDEIARRAGVGPGTLYRHFPTKEALFEAVVLDDLQQLVEEASRLAESEDPAGALFDFLEHFFEVGVAKRDLLEALVGAGIDIKARSQEAKDELNAALEVLLGRAQRAGGVRPDVSLDDLMGLVMGACSVANGHRGGAPSRMIAVVCDGLRTGGPG